MVSLEFSSLLIFVMIQKGKVTISDLSCGIMPLAESKAMPLGSSTEGPLSQDAGKARAPLIGGWQSSYPIQYGKGFQVLY